MNPLIQQDPKSLATNFKDLNSPELSPGDKIGQVLQFELSQLEQLVRNGQLERLAQPRIGIELEGWLVERSSGLACSKNLEVLDLINNPDWTYELGAFNLECRTGVKNLNSMALSELENELLASIAQANRMAHLVDATFVLTGSLPSLRESDTTKASLTASDRYARIDQLLGTLNDNSFKAKIEAPDGTTTTFERDSIALATVGCGVQPHLQVSPEDLVDTFNIVQGISALIVAISANSPLIMGVEGHKESRLIILEQIHSFPGPNGDPDQVRWFFGDNYISDILDPFRASLNFKPFMTEAREDCGTVPPELPNLRSHGSTVWMFNRARYDIFESKAHIRIECRVPSTAPTVIDNMANIALFYGLVLGIKDILRQTNTTPQEFFGPFGQVKANFYAAAKFGLEAPFTLGNHKTNAHKVLTDLMPIAHHGLALQGVDEKDISRFLGVIDQRLTLKIAPADILLAMLASNLKAGLSRNEALDKIVKDSFIWQERNLPVHSWLTNTA